MPSGRPSEGRWWATELLLSLGLAALTALAFSRPVLDTFGRSPATFTFRGVTRWWVVAFGLTPRIPRPPRTCATMRLEVNNR